MKISFSLVKFIFNLIKLVIELNLSYICITKTTIGLTIEFLHYKVVCFKIIILFSIANDLQSLQKTV